MNEQAPSPVSRTEIIDHVGEAFEPTSATRADLIEAGLRSSARPPLLDVLASLPDRTFQRPSDLWSELPDLPIGG